MSEVKIFVPAPDRTPPSNTLGPIVWVERICLDQSVVPSRHSYFSICSLVTYRLSLSGHSSKLIGQGLIVQYARQILLAPVGRSLMFV